MTLRRLAIVMIAFRSLSLLMQAAEANPGELIREDIRRGCSQLLENWLSAASSHPNSSGPIFQAATQQLLTLRERTSTAIVNSKIVLLDKAELAKQGDIKSNAYRYTRATGSLEFIYFLTTWEAREIVVVTDSRLPQASKLLEEFRIDYQIQVTDCYSALAADTVYSVLMDKDQEVARTVVNHIFGPWYAAQAIGRHAQNR